MSISRTLAKYPHDVQVKALTQTLANEYKASLFKTCKYLLGYAQMTKRTHGKMCDALEAPTKRKLIVMPRGTFKSSVGVVGMSIWLLLNNPNLRILIDSEKYENSKNFIREIKGKLEDPGLTRIFGPMRGHMWNEGEITISKRTRVLKEASITASGIGAGKVGQHYDVIIHDDLNTHENSQNPEQRKKIIQHYQLNVSILEPEGLMVVIGTRYAVSDLIGHIMEVEMGAGLLARTG